MVDCTISRTGQTPLTFQGEKIACVYGEWADGLLWLHYHNVIVYRTEDNRYVLSIQYRTGAATIHQIEQPHDHAVTVSDTTPSLRSWHATIPWHIGYTVRVMEKTTITYGGGIGRMLKSY